MDRSVYRVATLVLLSALGLLNPALSYGAPPQQAATSPSKTAANPSDYVGAETCALCHEPEVKGFSSDPHSKLALEHGGKGVTCESCHGPAKDHVQSGGVANKIFQFTKATPKQVEEKCLACHVNEHPNFTRFCHGEAQFIFMIFNSLQKF